jgi:transcriptional regulator with XRE-family HTH domain
MLYTHNLLRRYRRAAGLSQRDVARILGLERPASVSRWECGERIPTPGRLLELSCLYHRLVNDLLLPEYLATRSRIDARLHELNLRSR